MKQFNAEMNTVAVDVALEALYGVKGRDEAKRVYELINTMMANTFALGAASRDADLAQAKAEYNEAFAARSNSIGKTIQAAERIGYEKGHAAALFTQAVWRLNAEAAEVSPALAPQRAAPQEESALVNAVSALG